MTYWFTTQDPPVLKPRTTPGVWVHPGLENTVLLKPEDLVFVHEVSTFGGASAVIALIKIKKIVRRKSEEDWVRVAEAEFLAKAPFPYLCKHGVVLKILKRGEIRNFGKKSNHILQIDREKYLEFSKYFPDYVPEDELDIEDDDFQRRIEQENVVPPPSGHQKPEYVKIGKGKKLKVNPKIARYCLHKANYLCQVDPEHKTFISNNTKQKYVEAHHLIPLKNQPIFRDDSLDIIENIISLCPTCHRLLHNATLNEKRTLLNMLLGKAKQRMLANKNINVSEEDILNYY